MRNKFISLILSVAVIAGLMLVPATLPAVPGVVLASGGVSISVQPSLTKVGFNEAFDLTVVVDNPSAMPISNADVRLRFNTSYFSVESMDLGDMPFDAGQTWDNATGVIKSGPYMASGTNTSATTIDMCVIHCLSKLASGESTVDFLWEAGPPVLKTEIFFSATHYLEDGNMSLMHSGTVKAGKTTLTIAATDGSTMDVSFPNTTNSDRRTTLIGVAGPDTAAALVQFCPPANRSALGVNLSLLYVYATVNMTTGEMLSQIAYMLSDLDDPGGAMTMGEPVERYYNYDAGHGLYPYVSTWSYNVTMIIPGMAINATSPRWVNVTSSTDMVAVSSCNVPLGTVQCFHAVHTNCPPGVATAANVTYEEWIAHPGIPGPLNGTGTVQIKDYFWKEFPATPAVETSVLAGVHPALVSGHAASIVSINGTACSSLPNATQWAWDEVKGLSAVTYIPGWSFSHWTGPVQAPSCDGSTVTMSADMTVFPNYCEDPPALVCTDTTPLVFTCRAGDPDPVNQTLDVTNAGGYTAVWSASAASDTGWLSVAPPGGALAAGVHDTIQVHANSTATPGTYTGNVTITGSTVVIPVTLVVSTAETIDVCRDLPGNAMSPNSTYPGMTFSVTVNWTAPQDEFNSIGLTDVAPEGWVVTTDNSWCTPAADFNTSHGNKVEYMWADNYAMGTAFFATYNVTVPETAVPGLNVWEVCPDMDEAWLEYYYDWNGSYSSCIGCEFEMLITVPGILIGETRDVNANLLPDVLVTLKRSASDVNTDESTPNYEMTCLNTGSDYWLLATKDRYDDLSTVVIGGKSPHNRNLAQYIDWSTPVLLSAGNVTDFEADYGLVPMACDMSYSLRSVNLWLFWPTVDLDIYGTVINTFGLSVWKAMQSVDSWQNPS